MTATDDRRARREAVVLEHMQSENVQEWDRTMATFHHARYELPDGTVHDGAEDVMRYWIDGRTVVPDQRNELIELTHLDGGSVLIDFWLRGTPITSGRPFERRIFAVFDFDGDTDLLVNERVFLERPSA
jgi:hypothetical protein